MSAIVVACLALGIVINATFFSMVDGVLLQLLPFTSPERLVRLDETFERHNIRRDGLLGAARYRLQVRKRQPPQPTATACHVPNVCLVSTYRRTT